MGDMNVPLVVGGRNGLVSVSKKLIIKMERCSSSSSSTAARLLVADAGNLVTKQDVENPRRFRPWILITRMICICKTIPSSGRSSHR